MGAVWRDDPDDEEEAYLAMANLVEETAYDKNVHIPNNRGVKKLCLMLLKEQGCRHSPLLRTWVEGINVDAEAAKVMKSFLTVKSAAKSWKDQSLKHGRALEVAPATTVKATDD